MHDDTWKSLKYRSISEVYMRKVLLSLFSLRVQKGGYYIILYDYTDMFCFVINSNMNYKCCYSYQKRYHVCLENSLGMKVIQMPEPT